MNIKITQVIRQAIELPDIAKNTLVLLLDLTPKFTFKKRVITQRSYVIISKFSSLYLCFHGLWAFMFLIQTEVTVWK
jgi:hypothetical protein